ncbi:hypothetical protein [Fodinicola feengrottensis]|nr:hypothetical protein [Fodinicola feengrottensis]
MTTPCDEEPSGEAGREGRATGFQSAYGRTENRHAKDRADLPHVCC